MNYAKLTIYPELTYSNADTAQKGQRYNYRPVAPVRDQSGSAAMNGQPFGGRNTKPPLPPKPHAPMEVNQSLQTRQVDYRNRPQQYQPYSGEQNQHKRQLSKNVHQPQKYQRVFNTEVVDHQDPDPLEDYETQEDEIYQDEHIEDNNNQEQESTDDINFLD